MPWSFGRLDWAGRAIASEACNTPVRHGYPWCTGVLHASDAVGPGSFWAHQTYLWCTRYVYALDTVHSRCVRFVVHLRWLSPLSHLVPLVLPVAYSCSLRHGCFISRGARNFCTARITWHYTYNPASPSHLPKQPQHLFPSPSSNSPSSPPSFSHICHSF
jgi:hypothetical protein